MQKKSVDNFSICARNKKFIADNVKGVWEYLQKKERSDKWHIMYICVEVDESIQITYERANFYCHSVDLKEDMKLRWAECW